MNTCPVHNIEMQFFGYIPAPWSDMPGEDWRCPECDNQIPCWKITDITDKACHLYIRRDRGDESQQLDDALSMVKDWLLSKPQFDNATRFTIEAELVHPQDWEDMDIEGNDE